MATDNKNKKQSAEGATSHEISHLIVVFKDGSEITLEKDTLDAVNAASRMLGLVEGMVSLTGLMKKGKL
jgi:hypothetical protein